MSMKSLVITASFVLSASSGAYAKTFVAGFTIVDAPTRYVTMKIHWKTNMRRSHRMMSTGGHNSGGGTSSSGMSK